MKIEFSVFNLAAGDVLIAYDGGSLDNTVLGTFTGQALPPAILGTVNIMVLRMMTNAGEQYQGFAATVTFIGKEACYSWKQ